MITRSFLSFSCHPFTSSIAPDKSSRLHSVSAQFISDEIKQDFFQAVAVSVLNVNKTSEKKNLDGNYTKMLRAVLTKQSWKQQPQNSSCTYLRSHKLLKWIEQYVRCTAREVRTNSKAEFSYGRIYISVNDNIYIYIFIYIYISVAQKVLSLT